MQKATLKKKATLISLAMLLLPAGAYAQSNVTLYGLIDAGIAYTPNQGGASAFQAVNGAAAGSRWGLTGTEDLGDQTHAVFKLENGFNVMTGALTPGGQMFGRIAYVGLGNSNWGTVTMGRQYDAVVDTVQSFTSALWSTRFGSTFLDLDNLSNSAHSDNSVKYTSAVMNGFQAVGVYAFGNQPGSLATNSNWSIGTHYTAGNFSAGVAYADIKNPYTSMYDTNGVYEGFARGLYANIQQAQTETNLVAGALVKFGNTSVNAAFSHVTLRDLNASVTFAPGGNFSVSNYQVGILQKLTPALSVGAGYIYSAGQVQSPNKRPNWQQVNLGLDYYLSKHTDIYMAEIAQRAGGDGLGPNGQPIAQIAGITPSSGKQQFLTSLGMRHTF